MHRLQTASIESFILQIKLERVKQEFSNAALRAACSPQSCGCGAWIDFTFWENYIWKKKNKVAKLEKSRIIHADIYFKKVLYFEVSPWFLPVLLSWSSARLPTYSRLNYIFLVQHLGGIKDLALCTMLLTVLFCTQLFKLISSGTLGRACICDKASSEVVYLRLKFSVWCMYYLKTYLVENLLIDDCQ